VVSLGVTVKNLEQSYKRTEETARTQTRQEKTFPLLNVRVTKWFRQLHNETNFKTIFKLEGARVRAYLRQVNIYEIVI